MKYFLLCDPECSLDDLQAALAGNEDIRESLPDFCSHLSESREECQAMIDDPDVYACEGSHIIEFESDLDHEALSQLIFE